MNVTRDGESVLTGFVRSGVRLTVRLAKGDYVVYYTAGPEWYGESYLFGKEAAFGKFSLHVGDADRLVVHLEDTGGELAVEAMDWDSFPHPTPASPRTPPTRKEPDMKKTVIAVIACLVLIAVVLLPVWQGGKMRLQKERFTADLAKARRKAPKRAPSRRTSGIEPTRRPGRAGCGQQAAQLCGVGTSAH